MKLNIQKLLGAVAGIALVTTSIASSIQPAHAGWVRKMGRKVERSVGTEGRRTRRSVYRRGRVERSVGTEGRRIRRSVYRGGRRFERSVGTEVRPRRKHPKCRGGPSSQHICW